MASYGQLELENEMHERFCVFRSRGFSQGKAYQRANFNGDDLFDDGKEVEIRTARRKGYQLERETHIKNRISHLKARRMKKYEDAEKALHWKYREAVEDETYGKGDHLTALRDFSKFIGKMGDKVDLNGSIDIKVSFE